MRLYYPVWFRLGRLRDERRATTLPGPVFSPTGTRQLRLTHRNQWFADSSLEGTGFEIPVPRYPRWSRGSPRSAIRAEETGRIGVRFDSLLEGDGFEPSVPGRIPVRCELAVARRQRLASDNDDSAVKAARAFVNLHRRPTARGSL